MLATCEMHTLIVTVVVSLAVSAASGVGEASCDDAIVGDVVPDETVPDGGEPGQSVRVNTPRLRILDTASFWPTPVLIEQHGTELARSLLQVALWEKHRDPVGVLKSNRDGGWHSVSLINASAALGTIRSPDVHVAFHALLGAVRTAARRLGGVEPDRRVFVQNLWVGINGEKQGNVGHTHPYSFFSGVIHLDDGSDPGSDDDGGSGGGGGGHNKVQNDLTGAGTTSDGGSGNLVLFDPRSAVTCSSDTHRAKLVRTRLCPLCGDDDRLKDFASVGTSPLCSRRGEDPLIMQSTAAIRARPGQLVMFPSWLPHEVMPHAGPRDRVVMSFNVWVDPPRGTVGDQFSHESLPEPVLLEQLKEMDNLVASTRLAGIGVDPLTVPPSRPSSVDVQNRWVTTLTELYLEPSHVSRGIGQGQSVPLRIDAAVSDWLVKQCSSGCFGHNAIAAGLTPDAVAALKEPILAMRAALAADQRYVCNDTNPQKAPKRFSVVAWHVSGGTAPPRMGLFSLLDAGSELLPRAVCVLILAVRSDGTVVPFMKGAPAQSVADISHPDPRPGTASDSGWFAQAGQILMWRAQSSMAAIFPGFMTVEGTLQQAALPKGVTGVALFLTD